MAIYRNKYTLEFDDIIKDEFNDYKLEIFKKLETSTANNVYVSAYNNSGVNISQYDPVKVANGLVVKSKASDSSTMPSNAIATQNINNQTGTTVAGEEILSSGVLAHTFAPVVDVNYYVGQNGGVTDVTTGLSIIQNIGVQVSNNVFSLLDDEITLKGTGSPIQLNYNLVDDDILSSFRSSYLDISFYKESLSDDFLELFAAENDSFKVTLKKNNVLFWQGWIGSQLFSEPFVSPPYPISIRAYDGLHLLKNILYFDSVDVFQATSNLFNDRYGYHNIVDVIEKCIYNTGVLSDVFYCINISNSENSDTPTLFPTRARIHHQTFLNGESNSMNMEKVLQMVLKSLGATIYQRDGNWCVIKISDFTLSPIPVLMKRSDWIVDSTTETNYITTTETYTSSEDVSKNINLFQVDGGSTMTVQYPLKEVIVNHEFDHNMVTTTTIDSVRDLGADDPSGTYLFTEWESSGSNIQEAVVLRENEILSESKELSKSFIEADLSASGISVDYCDPSLYYPVSHNCTVDSSTITGLKASVKARPLGRNLRGDEALFLSFSPKLSYYDGTSTKNYGFGTVKTFETSMINKRILRMNAEAFIYAGTQPMVIQGLFVYLESNAQPVSWKIRITQNKQPFFESNTYTTPASTPNTQAYLFGKDKDDNLNWLEEFTLIEADYEVFFDVVTGSPYTFPHQFIWFLQGYKGITPNDPWDMQIWASSSNQLSETTRNFIYANFDSSTQSFTPKEGGNIGSTKPEVGETDMSADNFRKTFDCVSNSFLPTQIKSTSINQWVDYSVTATENWNNSISNLTLNMHIFGSGKSFGINGDEFNTPYLETYDVSYTDIKLLPLVSSSSFVPKKQEYIITQSGNFSSKLIKEIKIGSGLFNTGSNRYITFTSESGSTAKKSWDTFRDRRGLAAAGVENATMQHLLAACYMELYRVSVRRLDTTHYGNYKYGDKLMPIVNGTVETLNGSQGRFFPMNVVMDLKMARTSFSGDDLMDNTGTDWQSSLTKTIKWIGKNDITETETLT